jgi:hypothetical protein
MKVCEDVVRVDGTTRGTFPPGGNGGLRSRRRIEVESLPGPVDGSIKGLLLL